MAKIQRLDKQTSHQIAAGEVVTRPASVVKELLENALDAGADRIEVDLTAAGQERILVRDNGEGMEPVDAELALERSATSKIRRAADLQQLDTYGFRGEALASIAAVSRFRLRTRPADQPEGTEVRVEGGNRPQVKTTGCRVGTEVEVRDLFFNTPARRHQLKRESTEWQRIDRILRALALARPAVSFHVRHNERTRWQSPGTNRVRETILSIYDRDLTRHLIRLEPRKMEDVEMRLEGFIGDPTIARASRQHQYLLVNDRLVRHRNIQRALEAPYRALIEDGRYPWAYLSLRVDPEQLDVNIHPRKEEVRLEHETSIVKAVTKWVRDTLRQTGHAARWSAPAATRESEPEATAFDFRNGEDKPDAGKSSARSGDRSRPVLQELPAGYDREFEPENRPIKFGSLTVLSQVRRSFILCEDDEGLVVIDQHAAHERLYYEQFLRQYQQRKIVCQELAVPFEVPAHTAPELLSEHQQTLETLGFRFSSDGDRILVRSVPVLLYEAAGPAFFEELSERLTGDPEPPSLGLIDLEEGPVPLKELDRLITASCKAAVKFHDRLDQPEIEQLLEDLDRAENPYRCPHGRPTVLRLSFQELTRFFQR